MKVFVIGANGQIGQKLTDLLNSGEGHTVLAMVRNQDQKEAFSKKGLKPLLPI